MKIFLFFILILITATQSQATLTATYVPNVKTAGPPSTSQNGDIVDTGSSMGNGNVGVGSVNPNGILDVESTLRPIVLNAVASGTNVGVGSFNPGTKLDVQGTVRASNLNIGIGTASLRHVCVNSTGFSACL